MTHLKCLVMFFFQRSRKGDNGEWKNKIQCNVEIKIPQREFKEK